MKTEEIKLRKLIADSGKVFAKPDKSEIYGNEMYLGCGDSADNYIEIEEEEAAGIRALEDGGGKKPLFAN